MDSNTALVKDTVDVLTSADFTPVIKYLLIIIPHFRTESVTVTESTPSSPEKVTTLCPGKRTRDSWISG